MKKILCSFIFSCLMVSAVDAKVSEITVDKTIERQFDEVKDKKAEDVSDDVSANGRLQLWYGQPARNWLEALPVGNGRMGAMVYGTYPNETIQFNEESLWAGSQTQSDADTESSLKTIQQMLLDGEIAKAAALAEETMVSNPLRIRSYQTVGDVIINYAGTVARAREGESTGYRRNLDLATGIATSTFLLDGVRITQDVFISAVNDVIAIRISSEKAGALNFKISLARKQDATARVTGNNEITMQGQIIDLPRSNSSPAGMHMKFAARIAGFNKGGQLTAVNNSLFVENADEAVFYLTAATDYNMSILNFDRSIDPVQRCASIMSKVQGQTYETVKTAHVADHESIFNRVSLNLFDDAKQNLPTDKRLEAFKNGSDDKSFASLLFQYGRYLLMGASRRPGILPTNLQGIWNQDFDAPWNSDFHTNINIQMNYWPAEVCNLSETVIPFSDLINALRIPGRVTAKKTYQSTGWTMNHLTDVFGRTAISDGVGWGTYPMAASWLVLHQWEHYLFTKDLDFLREVYPTMKEAADFVLHFIVKDKNGKWVTAPSNSPENRYRLPTGETFMLTYGATKDIQLIRALFNACIKASALLGDDKKYAAQLQSVLKDLPPTKVSQRYGIIQEWIEDYEEVEPGHRHMSQLFGLYPGSEITSDNKTLFNAAIRTVERRQEYARRGEGSSPGWSKAWLINFYARLGDGDAAWNKAKELMRERILFNLFADHPPFQMDANFGFTAGIAEMLIQSHQDNLITLLPAIPKDWERGEVKGLKARGNITVDMRWEDHRLTAATLTAAQDCTVQVKIEGKVRKVTLKKGKPENISF
ncbi:MAG: glycoside hydrolase family 95 protein [Tannerella sp.]|nr:glycoside hydrolase family 95 protein [Tannerella sp.]